MHVDLCHWIIVVGKSLYGTLLPLNHSCMALDKTLMLASDNSSVVFDAVGSFVYGIKSYPYAIRSFVCIVIAGKFRKPLD